MIKTPPYLKKGDTIALVAPAGYMPETDFEQSIETLQQWGFNIRKGHTPANQFHYFSGTDEERKNDLQEMLDDPDVKAILCVRGGYGTGRIIDDLDFTKFKKNPKWLIGFSDVTVLHNHIFTNCKVATLHAPMSAAFNDGEWNNQYVESLKKALTGKKGSYKANPHPYNHPGAAEGILVGGNLALLTHLIGTKSDINTNGKILFIEDIGEYVYSVDRMMIQLKRAGKLNQLKGLIVGSFNDMKDTDIPFGQPVYDVIRDHVEQYNYPISFGFPVGHEKENFALKVGVEYELKVTKRSVSLKEK